MKKALIPMILSVIFLSQANLSFAESQSFTLVVVIPAMVQMAGHDTLSAPTPDTAQMMQEQKMVRGNETILMRSIVAL